MYLLCIYLKARFLSTDFLIFSSKNEISALGLISAATATGIAAKILNHGNQR